jgi:hypothetical protein
VDLELDLELDLESMRINGSALPASARRASASLVRRERDGRALSTS